MLRRVQLLCFCPQFVTFCQTKQDKRFCFLPGERSWTLQPLKSRFHDKSVKETLQTDFVSDPKKESFICCLLLCIFN